MAKWLLGGGSRACKPRLRVRAWWRASFLFPVFFLSWTYFLCPFELWCFRVVLLYALCVCHKNLVIFAADIIIDFTPSGGHSTEWEYISRLPPKLDKQFMLLGSAAALFFQKLVCAIFPKPIFAQADFQKSVRTKFPKRIFAQTYFLRIFCLACFPNA